MATATISLQVGSAVGFQQVGGGDSTSPFIGPFPTIKTVYSLDGVSSNLVEPPRAVLYVNSFTEWVFSPGLSDPKPVRFDNLGNIPLTITNIAFVSRGGVNPIFSRTFPWTIGPNSFGILNLAYESANIGLYSNWFIVESNNYSFDVRVTTVQRVNNYYTLELIPAISTVTIINYGGFKDVELIPVAYRNSILDSNLTYTLSTSTQLGAGWSLLPYTSPNKIRLRYEVDLITTQTNANAVVEVTAGFPSGVSVIATATVYGVVNIDPNQFKNYYEWTSPVSPYNSIIGISYDLILGVKTVTIGVGTGGDSTRIVGTNPRHGALSALTNNLSYRSGPDSRRNLAYFSWAEVWRFPLGNNQEVLLSGTKDEFNNLVYKQKTDNPMTKSSLTGIGIDYYFGAETSEGSMFILEHDGKGNVEIYINHVREYSTSSQINSTLYNLSRAFYYYSNVDSPVRLYGVNKSSSSTYSTLQNYENQTYVFQGLTYNTLTDLANVMTYISPLPT